MVIQIVSIGKAILESVVVCKILSARLTSGRFSDYKSLSSKLITCVYSKINTFVFREYKNLRDKSFDISTLRSFVLSHCKFFAPFFSIRSKNSSRLLLIHTDYVFTNSQSFFVNI